MNTTIRHCLLAAAIALGGGALCAQVTTATFYGIVNDPSGAAVPNATVTLIHESTGTTTARTTDNSGEVAFDFLRVGAYTLRIELTGSMMIESGYVGVRGVKFLLHRRVNLADRLTGVRPNPNIIFGGYYVDNSQNTDYNAWQTSFRKRFSKGLSFDTHYTWGKSLGISGGDIGAYYGSDNDSNVIQDFHDIRSNRGPNAGDASHRLLADWIYDLPRFPHSRGLVRNTIGGWQVSGIFSARSGNRITISETCASDWFCRPDYAGGPLVVDNWKETTATRCTPGARRSVQFINKSAFALVPVDPRTRIAIRPGNLGNGILRGPASAIVDFSLSKNFKFRERMNLQVRGDMFNFLNHVNYSDPSAGLNSATFGEINGAGGMRVIQLNGRITW